MPVIIHLAADALMTDLSDIAGAILHYAQLKDAAARHKFVKSVVSWHSPTHDFLGKPFERVPEYLVREADLMLYGRLS